MFHQLKDFLSSLSTENPHFFLLLPSQKSSCGYKSCLMGHRRYSCSFCIVASVKRWQILGLQIHGDIALYICLSPVSLPSLTKNTFSPLIFCWANVKSYHTSVETFDNLTVINADHVCSTSSIKKEKLFLSGFPFL